MYLEIVTIYFVVLDILEHICGKKFRAVLVKREVYKTYLNYFFSFVVIAYHFSAIEVKC
jgi:hypothetical protein